MNILFSPIGTTDPISEYNLREGAMLHICRYRQIDKVYMYMSGEICSYHDKDNRYVYCLEKLSEELGREISYEITERRDLVDEVNSFDFFKTEFRQLVNEIHEKNPEDTIFLNVSSGTPGMKSALQTLEAFVNYKVVPIQVATPTKKSNGHAVDKNNYDPQTIWELNEDSSANEDRTSVSDNSVFFAQIKKNNINELIRKYDYVGAAAIADSMKETIDSEFLELIHAADLRFKLNFGKAKTVFSKYGFAILETETAGLAEISEYLLILDIKLRREEYVDFLRGITPVIADLFEMILKNQCGFDVNDYVCVDSNDKRNWDIRKLIKNQAVIDELNNRFNPRFKAGPVYSSAMMIIIETLSDNNELIDLCKELRNTEEELRNDVAHEITGMSEENIIKKLGFTAADIVKKLRKALYYAGVVTGKTFFESYDRMNWFLISKNI